MENQHLSPEEIDLIVNKVCDNLEKKLYLNIGQGVLAVLWKGVILVGIAIAGYGAGVHWLK